MKNGCNNLPTKIAEGGAPTGVVRDLVRASRHQLAPVCRGAGSRLRGSMHEG